MEKKSYTVHGIDANTLDLLRDSKDRFEREHAISITFQVFLKKILKVEADAEKARQIAAGEYAKQQEEDAQ